MTQQDFLTLDEALVRLKVKPATVYSYVSRGLIRRIPQSDPRKSRYAREDVDRLASRKRGRIGGSAAAESSMRWGEPVIQSTITYISHSGPVYRNRSAIDLANSGAAFESVALLLYTGLWQEDPVPWPTVAIPRDLAPFLAAHAGPVGPEDIGNLLAMITLALGMKGRGAIEMNEGNSVAAARMIVQTMIGCIGLLLPARKFIERLPGETIAAYVLRASGAKDTPAARRAVNVAMIVLADHELAAATFTARVAASTNATLFNCVAAAISSHVGFTVGTATNSIETQLLGDLKSKKLLEALDLVRDYGANRFGFNHPLYGEGDPRAELILDTARELVNRRSSLATIFPFLETVRKSGAKPGVALALAVLTKALGMAPGSATVLWIIARSTGWVAHALEQRSQAFMMRPRARYGG